MNKYLKYKYKYLELKKQLEMNAQLGGANCPKRGYSQHIGECWHDSLSTIFLYADELSEHAQELFDNPDFNINNIINRPNLHEYDYLMPINIDDAADYDKFKEYSTEYIINLRYRYLNDKLPTKLPLYESRPITKLSLPEATTPIRRLRRNSISESLTCTEALYNITNINNANPKIFTKDFHPGSILISYIIYSTINYFLSSYVNKFINVSYFHMDSLFNQSIIEMINELEDMKAIIKTAHAISIIISNNKHNQSHQVAFFSCNEDHYFYDDNGVYDPRFK
jgi:hypothetical protein